MTAENGQEKSVRAFGERFGALFLSRRASGDGEAEGPARAARVLGVLAQTEVEVPDIVIV